MYSCQGNQDGSIEVVAWTVATDWSSATRDADPLAGGLPLDEDSGRHGGCRLEFAPDGALLVGTGDTAAGSVPQDPDPLGGKVLQVDPATGEVTVWTSGHRNVQGLAVRPGSDQVFAVEHGPDRDDEVDLLREGGDYVWDPDGDGSYDESVPMTGAATPGAIEPSGPPGCRRWLPAARPSSPGSRGPPTTGCCCGAAHGPGVLGLRLDDAGGLVEQFRVPEPGDAHGRIRTVQQGGDGALYAVTDNGSDDRLLRITPDG